MPEDLELESHINMELEVESELGETLNLVSTIVLEEV